MLSDSNISAEPEMLYLLKITKYLSRHTRKSKPTRKYILYLGVSGGWEGDTSDRAEHAPAAQEQVQQNRMSLEVEAEEADDNSNSDTQSQSSRGRQEMTEEKRMVLEE